MNKFDIHLVDEGVQEPTETFTVKLDVDRLPPGIVAGNRTSATAEILDASRDEHGRNYNQQTVEARCADDPTLAECGHEVNFKILTNELYESDFNNNENSDGTHYIATFAIEITSNRDVTNGHRDNYLLELTNTKGDRGDRAHPVIPLKPEGGGGSATNFINLTSNIAKTYQYRLLLPKDKNANADYPDGQVGFDYLASGDAPLSNAAVSGTLWIRDDVNSVSNRTRLSITDATSGHFKDNSLDNLFTFGTTSRDLMTWERARKELRIGSVRRGDGTRHAITKDDYDIEVLSGQSNVNILTDSGGIYVLSITGTNTDPTVTTTDTFTCGSATINPSRQGCFRYVNKRKGTYGLSESYAISLQILDSTAPEAELHRYQSVNMGTWHLYPTDRFEKTVNPEEITDPQTPPNRTVSLTTSANRTVQEPEPNGKSGISRSWTDVPFDILIEPDPISGSSTLVKLCTKDTTTASYYADYRIV